MLDIWFRLHLIYAAKRISNTVLPKIDWKATLFFSIATVRCWAPTWSWQSWFSPCLVCVCVFVLCALYTSRDCLFVCLCLFVYGSPRRCLCGWLNFPGRDILASAKLVITRQTPRRPCHEGTVKESCVRIQFHMQYIFTIMHLGYLSGGKRSQTAKHAVHPQQWITLVSRALIRHEHGPRNVQLL